MKSVLRLRCLVSQWGGQTAPRGTSISPWKGSIHAITVAVAIIVYWPAKLRAANYYVATNGSNGNAGTLAQPFLTIQQAANAAQAGDNVYVAGGRTARR